MNLLISGGAGYVGSHTVKIAQSLGHNIVVIDNLSTGHIEALDNVELIELDLMDRENLSKCLKGRHFDGVIHFAAKSIVAESINNPDIYYKNNILGSINLIEESIKNNYKNFVFSSSAAVYGNPEREKIHEKHPTNPINPYGKSKLFVENIYKHYSNHHNINITCFRYFNAAGAFIDASIGESHNPETHLIPNILNSVLFEKNNLKIYGNDYPTKDGTCIRDYVHVSDLAHAHLLAINENYEKYRFRVFNLGSSEGFSVIDIINSVERIIGKKVKYKYENRREGDPPILIADSSFVRKELKWKPIYSDIDSIINSACDWHKNKRY